MDPITVVILVFIIVGSTSDFSPEAQAEINDAYKALKESLKRKLGSDNEVLEAIEALEKNPDSEARQNLVKEALVSTEVNDDLELVQQAQEMLELIQQLGGESIGVSLSDVSGETTKYEIDLRGSQIGVIGDNAYVEGGIHFGRLPGEPTTSAPPPKPKKD